MLSRDQDSLMLSVARLPLGEKPRQRRMAWTAMILVVVVLCLTFAPSLCLVILLVIGKIATQFDKKGKATKEQQGDAVGGGVVGNSDGGDRVGGSIPLLPITRHDTVVQGSSSAYDAYGAEKKRSEPGSSSTSSSSSRCKYDVFLSFRGTDTRGFVDSLHRALLDAGTSVFKGPDELGPEEEDDILPQVKEAIKGSRISTAILSTDYASTKWCLDELVQMLECRELNGQAVIPIFYETSPSDVRKQAGDFGEAFSLHRTVGVDSETIETWRQALRRIGELKGYSANLYKGYEARLIEEVALSVARKLRDDGLVVTDKLVGIDHHVEEMMRKLGVACSEGQATEVCGGDVCVVGIYGERGAGKTTLAKVIFNQMRKLFEASSFLEGISSKEVRYSQQMLISDLQKLEHGPLESSDEGTEKIASLFRERKTVLIVLDDLDEDEKFNALAGKLTWLGPRSRIITTTTKREVLSAFRGADNYETVEEHEVEPMNYDHALQLFCNRAFQGTAVQDVSEYFALSGNIVEAIGGIPRDIVHRASYLRNNMDMHIWKSTLELLEDDEDEDEEEEEALHF